jgi:hypothetical protein
MTIFLVAIALLAFPASISAGLVALANLDPYGQVQLIFLVLLTVLIVQQVLVSRRHAPPADLNLGSVEWVPGTPGAWLAWWLFTLPWFLPQVVLLVLMSDGTLPFDQFYQILFLSFNLLFWLSAIVFSLATRTVALNRKIGLSPTHLTWSNGIRSNSFAWENLGWLAPTRLTVFSAPRARLNLTETQAEKVRRCRDALDSDRATEWRNLPPPWVTVYDPRSAVDRLPPPEP